MNNLIQILYKKKPYYINEFKDFIELVENTIGYDARKYLENYIEEMQDTIEDLAVDLKEYQKEYLQECEKIKGAI